MLLYKIGNKIGYRSAVARFSNTKDGGDFYYFDIDDAFRRKIQKFTIPLSLFMAVFLVLNILFRVTQEGSNIIVASLVMVISIINTLVPKKIIIDTEEEAKLIDLAPARVYIEWLLLMLSPALVLASLPHFMEFYPIRIAFILCAVMAALPFMEAAYYYVSKKAIKQI